MLPLLMMMQNGNKGNKSKGNGNPMGGMDINTMMQMMSMLSGMNGGGNATNTSQNATTTQPINPDLSKINGMLSPEMLSLLSNLANKKD